ncbi:hypothetical protein RA307_12605 [Xanthobacteraceae bacterium Astr-EGSB]|uniref:hypothetical protein n=1 Tax=Astrobacterium formosum TaxID=3069710 RepID=UPI0027B6A4C6|nr:hypothetical protein [Xanthobacteraceae bacterium Astr-EGSB]
MAVGFYVIIRFLLWALAVVVALLPVVFHDEVDVDFNPIMIARSVNAHGHFRELLFVVVPVSLLAISSLLDYLCKKFFKMSGTSLFLTVLALIFNGCALASGLVGFAKLSANATLRPSQYLLWMTLTILAIVFSFMTEVGVAMEHRR